MLSLSLALGALGCGPKEAPPAPAPPADPAVTISAGPAPEALFDEAGGVPDPADRRCADLGTRCAAPYLRLARSLGSPRRDCEGAIDALKPLDEADRTRADSHGAYATGARWDEARLGAEITDTLGLRRFPPAKGRPLVAYGPSEPTPAPGGVRTTWILADPVLGAQRLLLHTPDTPGPHPAILALPGHQESPQEFMDLRGGSALLAAGYAVLLPVFKAYDADHAEDEAGRALFCVGSSLVAVRAVEASNALRLLRVLPGIADAHPGLVGHSGGSMLGNLLVRLEPWLGAYVSDMTGLYLGLGDRGPSLPPLLMDETHPGLRRMSDRIARFEGPVPVLQVPYGYDEGLDRVVAFLDYHLRGLGAPPPRDDPDPGRDHEPPPPEEPPPTGDQPPAAVEDLGDVDPTDDRPTPPPGGTLSRSIERWLDSPGVRSCRDLAAADLDGDGTDELALATDDEPDRVWGLRDGVLRELWVGPAPTIARGVAWADADGDGDPDLAFGVNNGAAPVFRNDGGALVPWWSGREERLAKGIAWVDFDGDGDPDLALADSAYSEFVRNDGGTFSSWFVSPVDRRHEDAVAVDIDGDGRQEVAFAVSQPGPPPFEVWRFDGRGFVQMPLDVEPGPRASAVAFADVDGDGRLDVALARPGDRDAVLFQDQGTFRVAWTSEAAVQTRVVTFWDADRDGDPDLVLGEDGPLALYENQGGTLRLAWRSAESDDTEGLTTADLDGDGHPELVTCAQKDAPLRVYRSVAR